jgi:hypothetical protein
VVDCLGAIQRESGLSRSSATTRCDDPVYGPVRGAEQVQLTAQHLLGRHVVAAAGR